MNFQDRFKGKTQIIDKNGIDAVVRKDQSQPINKEEILKQMTQQQSHQTYNRNLKVPYSDRSLSLNNYEEKSNKGAGSKQSAIYNIPSKANILNGSTQNSNASSAYSQYPNQFYNDDQSSQTQQNHLSQSQFSKQPGYQDFYQPSYQPDFSQNINVSQDQTKRYNRQQFIRSPAYSQDYTQDYIDRLQLKEKNAFTINPNSNAWVENPFQSNQRQNFNFNSTLEGVPDIQRSNHLTNTGPANGILSNNPSYYKNPQIYYTPDKSRKHHNSLRPDLNPEIVTLANQYYPNSAHSSYKNTIKNHKNEPPIFRPQQILDEQSFINRLDLREQIRSKMSVNNDKTPLPQDRKQYIYSQGKQYSENSSPLKYSQQKQNSQLISSINDSPTLINSGKRLLNDQIPRNQRSIKLQSSSNY